MLFKGVQGLVIFTMTDKFNQALTGIVVAGVISKDGEGFVSTVNSPEEMANGFYKVLLTAEEMDAEVLAVGFTGIGAIQRDLVIHVWSDFPEDIKSKVEDSNVWVR